MTLNFSWFPVTSITFDNQVLHLRLNLPFFCHCLASLLVVFYSFTLWGPCYSAPNKSTQSLILLLLLLLGFSFLTSVNFAFSLNLWLAVWLCGWSLSSSSPCSCSFFFPDSLLILFSLPANATYPFSSLLLAVQLFVRPIRQSVLDRQSTTASQS